MKKALEKQCKFAENKHEAKSKARQQSYENGEQFKQVKGIYSFNTLKSYDKAATQFIKYVLKHHSEVKTLGDCKKYVHEYLQDQQNRGLSAWTTHLHGSALASVFDCDKKSFDFDFPQRKRADITRSRSASTSHDRVSGERFNRIKEFLIATGARRCGLMRLTKDDLREREGGLEIHLREKNGMERWARVLPDKEDVVREIFNTSTGYAANDGTIHLFHKSDVPTSLPTHSYRAEYARAMYSQLGLEGKATGKLYHCRKDRAGEVFDKGILTELSKQIGHKRNDVVLFYLR